MLHGKGFLKKHNANLASLQFQEGDRIEKKDIHKFECHEDLRLFCDPTSIRKKQSVIQDSPANGFSLQK